ncbi:MAG: hypothetical protein M3Q45_08850, partial [Chloroflexota bacterium]|nr:hypothetical protein [Chloroflexota bacterium]
MVKHSRKAKLVLFGCFCFTLLIGQLVLSAPGAAGRVWAAPGAQSVAVSAAELYGALSGQHSAHYFGLEATERDAIMVLTLAYAPQDNPDLRGLINFLVLTEDGLRQYLAGAELAGLNVAAGSPLQFDPVGNKMRAAFRDSGRGQYTVIVYNNATVPVEYTLAVSSGVLYDDANQAQSLGEDNLSQNVDESAASVEAAPLTPATSTVFNTVRARRVSGALGTVANRHFLALQPGVRDAQLDLQFAYDPQDQPALVGNVNFWVLDEDRMRRMVNGENLRDINLATGFPVPFSPFANQLQAGFLASGYGPYTLVVYNQAPVPATYALTIEGGLLVDQYNQTNEAKAAVAEAAALAPTALATVT